jgi:uncharacterized protein (TIGR04141 family)
MWISPNICGLLRRRIGPQFHPMLERTMALTIFLLRAGIDPTKALKAASRLQRMRSIRTTLFSSSARRRVHPHGRDSSPIEWVQSIGRVKSAAAVLIRASTSRHFAVVFGTGRYLLDLQAIEQRFGLLTTLNAVDPRKVRSIDKSSLDRQGMQSRIQASRVASAKDFGLDIEQDLVRAVAGMPIDGLLGETIAGFDSLHVSTRIEISELRQRLAVYLAKSQQTLYRREFGSSGGLTKSARCVTRKPSGDRRHAYWTMTGAKFDYPVTECYRTHAISRPTTRTK